MREVVYLPETRPYPEQIDGLVSETIASVGDIHAAKQTAKHPDLQCFVDQNTWDLMHYAASETASFSDTELWARAMSYDQDVLDEDKLGQEERRYRGSLLDRNQQWFEYYATRSDTANSANALAMMELRKEVAVRTLRLAYLSRLGEPDFIKRLIDYQLVKASELTASVTEIVWRRLVTNLPETANDRSR